MKGIKGEEEKAGKRRIAAGEEGIFRGEKRAFHPSSGEGQEGGKRGKRGKKNVSR